MLADLTLDTEPKWRRMAFAISSPTPGISRSSEVNDRFLVERW